MVYGDATVLLFYLTAVMMVQLFREGILREIFRIKGGALILAMIANIGKRVSIHFSNELISLRPEITFASLHAGWIHGHVNKEPQIYLYYGLSCSLMVFEQMLNALLLFDIFLSCCKMEVRENVLISIRIKIAFLLPLLLSIIPLEILGLQSLASTMTHGP